MGLCCLCPANLSVVRTICILYYIIFVYLYIILRYLVYFLPPEYMGLCCWRDSRAARQMTIPTLRTLRHLTNIDQHSTPFPFSAARASFISS